MIAYLFLRVTIFLFYLTPFFLIYFYADIFYLFIYYVVRYRRKTVYKNLKIAFKDKPEKEIKKIEKKFYKHLSILTLESLKFFSLKKEKILKRVDFINPELQQKFFDNNQSLIYASGHIGNYELGSLYAPLVLPHILFVMYKPLKNKHIDKYIKKHREINNSKLVSIFTPISQYFNKEKPMALVMLGDQNPSNKKKAIWINFFNKPTACLHGIEKYSKKYNLPIVYFSIIRVKKGYYQIKTETLITDPQNQAKGYITYVYMKHLEQEILEHPEQWLWSHRRWKHNYESNFKLYKF